MSPKDATPPPKPRASSFSLSNTEAEALFDEALASMAPRAWEPLEIAEAARLLPAYEIQSLLGRGGMGAVYLARQKSLDRTVALKLLPREISNDEAFVQRFTREAQTLGRLQHPNIVTAHEFDRTSEGHFFFVMEYIKGTDLARLLRERPLTPKEVANIFLTICDALQYAHQEGVIHRDIKPANVLLGAQGRVKVADFGLSRPLSLKEGLTHTQPGTVIGTPVFMAPEQLEGKSVDHRADIYALGVTLYEMLCRELPRGAFQLPSQLVRIDRRFDALVSRAMRPQPSDRFQSVADMRDAVAKIGHSRAAYPRAIRLSWTAAAAVAAVGVYAGVHQWAARPTQEPSTTIAPANPSPTPPITAVQPASAQPSVPLPPASSPQTTAAAPTNSAAPASFHTASRSNPYVNSMGMKFVPVPITGGPSHNRRVLVSIWETRVQDFETFMTADRRPWNRPPYTQTTTHPATGLNWEEARAFCGWLTMRERASGQIGQYDTYRMLTDHEWTCAIGIGLHEDPFILPEEKNREPFKVYPWGTGIFTPPPGAENYSGEETIGHSVSTPQPVLQGYRDPFTATAPVGSLTSNVFGIFDLAGNVREWCDDWYGGDFGTTVQRGASFACARPVDLLSSKRTPAEARSRDWQTGFRIVLTTTDIPIYRTRVAPPRITGEWVDWFSEQRSSGYAQPNFAPEAVGWRYRSPMNSSLLAPSVSDVAVRIRFQSNGNNFGQPLIALRRTSRSGNIHTGYTAQVSKDGTARILQNSDVSPQTLAAMRVPDFDPTAEVTLEFQADGDQFRMAVNGRELSATHQNSYGAGTCWFYIPPGNLIHSLEYRLPQ